MRLRAEHQKQPMPNMASRILPRNYDKTWMFRLVQFFGPPFAKRFIGFWVFSNMGGVPLKITKRNPILFDFFRERGSLVVFQLSPAKP